jgi:hypothetical protein
MQRSDLASISQVTSKSITMLLHASLSQYGGNAVAILGQAGPIGRPFARQLRGPRGGLSRSSLTFPLPICVGGLLRRAALHLLVAFHFRQGGSTARYPRAAVSDSPLAGVPGPHRSPVAAPAALFASAALCGVVVGGAPPQGPLSSSCRARCTVHLCSAPRVVVGEAPLQDPPSSVAQNGRLDLRRLRSGPAVAQRCQQ